jgi:hypothetical protein
VSAPFRTDTAALLPYTLGQGATLQATHPSWAAPVDLELQQGTITWDELQAPRCTATLTVHVPEDPALLDLLDPRNGVRLLLRAGYVRPDGPDLQPVADLLLTDRTVLRPANLLELQAAGEETVALQSRPTVTVAVGTDLGPAVLSTLQLALGYAPNVVENTLRQQNLAAATILETQEWWPQIDDWLNRADGDLWDDGLRRWHLTPRPVLGEPRAVLEVGAAGTLTGTNTRVSRQGWFNAVQLTYRWQTVTYVTVTHDKDGGLYNESLDRAVDLSKATRARDDAQAELDSAIARGSASAEAVARVRLAQAQATRDTASSAFTVAQAAYDASGTSVQAVTEDHVIVGTAVAGGQYAPAVAGGRVTYYEELNVATTQAAADGAAAVVLKRKLALGRSLDLEGIAHWWLRPGHTVRARLVTGGTEDTLASAVSFDLTAGRMRVRTRRPDNDTTILRGG